MTCVALLLGALPGAKADDGAAVPSSAAADKKKEAAVRLLGSGSARFEVMAEPGPDGVRLAELANSAWLEWRESLALPDRLPTAITVRLAPSEKWPWGDKDRFVAADAGGIVSVWIRAGGDTGAALERKWLLALAEGALRRKTFLLGAHPDLARVPAWLAEAAAMDALIARRPAMLDAWQASLRGARSPARLREVLLWDGAAEEVDARASSALGVWFWLRETGDRSGAWARFVNALLGGESPGAVLAREYGALTPRPAESREWELAWRVAAARLAAAQVTPVMEPAESRRRLERLGRLVVHDTRANAERVLSDVEEWESRGEAWMELQRVERTQLLAADLARFHPFYRNAAVSLGRAWTALVQGRQKIWREAKADWLADMAAGRELEEASARLLDEAAAAGR